MRYERTLVHTAWVRSLLLVSSVDDLHEISGLQGSAADQAAVSPIRPGPDGFPREF